MEAHKGSPQGDGADRPYKAPEHDRSEMEIVPGWEWLRELARPRHGFVLSLSRHPWTLFGEVRGSLTMVTNGWFMLAFDGDVGYPVATDTDAAQLRSVLRLLPETPARVFPLELLRAFVGLSADPNARCGRCYDARRAACPSCTREQRREFAPPCVTCEGRQVIECPDCVVSDDPIIEPIRIGEGLFNRAVLAPVLRRLNAKHVAWRQAHPEKPATIRADHWTLVLSPLKPSPVYANAPVFRALGVAA